MARILELLRQPFTLEGAYNGLIWYALPGALASFTSILITALADVEGVAVIFLWVGLMLLFLSLALMTFDRFKGRKERKTASRRARAPQKGPAALASDTTSAARIPHVAEVGSASMFGDNTFPGMPSHNLIGDQVKLILAVDRFGSVKSCSVRDPNGVTTGTSAVIYPVMGISMSSSQYEVMYPRDFREAGRLRPGKYHVSWFGGGVFGGDEPARYTFTV